MLGTILSVVSGLDIDSCGLNIWGMNTKKDFERAAALVRATREKWANQIMTDAFVAFFQGENPRFDAARFREACKPAKAEPSDTPLVLRGWR